MCVFVRNTIFVGSYVIITTTVKMHSRTSSVAKSIRKSPAKSIPKSSLVDEFETTIESPPIENPEQAQSGDEEDLPREPK